jgi:insulysin
VTVSGFNDKLHVLLQEILECVVNLQVDVDVFNIVKEKVKRELKNFDQEMPYHHAMYYWVIV